MLDQELFDLPAVGGLDDLGAGLDDLGAELGGFDGFSGDPFDALGEPGEFDELLTPDAIVGDAEESPPIGLVGRDLERFSFRFRAAFDDARSRMSRVHAEARRDRELYRMLPKEAPYKGGPDVTTPLIANKVDGVVAHFRDAVEQKTLFSVSSNTNSSVAALSGLTPLLESLLEAEIVASGSRERIASSVEKEMALVGTAIARLSVASSGGENVVQVPQLIPIERFYVDRIDVDDLNHVTCFYEFKERLYVLEEWAERGFIDAEALEEFRFSLVGGGTPESLDEELSGFSGDVALQEENQLVSLVRGYMWFKAEGGRAEIYECLMTRNGFNVLSLRLNPFSRAFNKPPLALLRIGKTPGQLFGRGIAARLRPQQRIADNAVNTHIATNNFRASPPFVYSIRSPYAAILERSQVSGLVPGLAIPTDGSSLDAGFKQVELSNHSQGLQDYALAQDMASQGTFTEEALGSPTGGRKTLGQFSIEVQKGTTRLRTDLGDFAYDAAEFGSMYLAALVVYKLQPRGVMEVSKGGRLVAFDSIPESRWRPELHRLAHDMFLAGEVGDPDELIRQFIDDRLTFGLLPFVRGNELKVSLRGTKIIADKMGELDTLMNVAYPLYLNFAQLAEQDVHAHRLMSLILRTAGIDDAEGLMPAEPVGALSSVNDFSALASDAREHLNSRSES